MFHTGTISLKKWLPSEGKNVNPTEDYIKRGKLGKKFTNNFLNPASIKDFENSRA